MTSEAYLTAEARARVEIDRQLVACGWVVQDRSEMNLYAVQGVAVREFIMVTGHGRADYLLFVDGKAVGAVEAKPSGTPLAGVEPQSAKYAAGLPKDLPAVVSPLPFLYESTGDETMFTDGFDPEPRSRPVVTFHRPESFARWLRHWVDDDEGGSLRARLERLSPVGPEGLRRIQVHAINRVEGSMVHNHPRALAQMATGSGKTFMAANLAYRLVLTAGAERVLFLVDRANLGRQTLREFQQFATPGDGRKFTDLYNVQWLTSNRIDPAARVVITTVQRLYSMLRGEEELPEDVDEKSGSEIEPDRPVDVTYNPQIPIETFDVVIVDECHRSIYGVWRQVVEYFDAFLVGLTATPAKQTFGFFNQNLVVEYGHAEAVADGVNVDFDVYRIRTKISEQGSTVEAGLVTKFRERETRKVRLEKLDEDVVYDAKQLDRDVVAVDQIRTVIRTFRDNLLKPLDDGGIFPGRSEVPKTLIFAKDDSHADDIVRICREEFGSGNDFAVKITYRTTGVKPEDLLNQFRNSFNPRIAVTVDMIATGTDVRPLECVMLDAGEAGLRTVRQLLKRMRAAVLAAAVTGRLVPQDPTDTSATKLLADLGVQPECAEGLPQGWCAATVAHVSELVTDGDHRPPRRVPSGVPHLTAKNVRDGRLVLAGCSFVDEEGFAQTRTRYEPRQNDVIVTCVGSVGRVAVVPAGLTFSADRNLAALRLSTALSPRFARVALEAPDAQQRMAEASGATAQPHLYLRDLRALVLPVPPQEEQLRIVAEVDRQFSFLGACERAADAELTRSAALRRSVLKAAFEGRLVPQDPSDEPAALLLDRIRAERAAAPKPARRARRTA